LGDRLERAIVGAADRGVRVTLIVPYRANRGIVRLWRRRTLERFQHANIALLGYRDTGGMLHAKFAIVDGRRATFGSFNMFELAMDQGAKFGFVGIFLIALVANLSLVIQIPYTLPVLAAAIQGDSLAHMLELGLAAGIGSGIGALISYVVADKLLDRVPDLAG